MTYIKYIHPELSAYIPIRSLDRLIFSAFCGFTSVLRCYGIHPTLGSGKEVGLLQIFNHSGINPHAD